MFRPPIIIISLTINIYIWKLIASDKGDILPVLLVTVMSDDMVDTVVSCFVTLIWCISLIPFSFPSNNLDNNISLIIYCDIIKSVRHLNNKQQWYTIVY
jgi:hypothetical protein